jgi:hypothetical protein
LFTYERATGAIRLVTGGTSATTSYSRQAQYVGISSDSRYLVYSTDYLENITGFTAPGKPVASLWTLVDGGYPTASGKQKNTAVRVADLDPTKLTFQMSGGYIDTDNAPATVSTVTILRPSTDRLTFWVGVVDGSNVKAVKLDLQDNSSGILVKATAAKYGSTSSFSLQSNWETSGSSGTVAGGLNDGGYGVSLLQASGSNLTSVMLKEGAVAARDLVAYDLVSGQSILLTHSATSRTQSQAADVSNQVLSVDGRHVLFTAANAAKLGNDGTAFTDSAPAVNDLFATNLQTGEIRLLSRAVGNSLASAGVAMTLQGTTANGHAIVSVTDASAFGFTDSAPSAADLLDIDLATGAIRLITRASASNTGTSAGAAGTVEKITGSHVYFYANDATKFGFTDPATGEPDLFRYDAATDSLLLLSHATTSTTQALNAAFRTGSVTASADARYVAFVSNLLGTSGGFTASVTGNGLFLADTHTGAIRLLNATNAAGNTLSYSAWGNPTSKPRFFTSDGNSFVWQTSGYLGWTASDMTGYGAGADNQNTDGVMLFDLSQGVPAAGTN